ncbi:hypothetical protein Tco_1094947, partial [Tanacetum coccineum]
VVVPGAKKPHGFPLLRLDRVLALETDLRQTKKVYGAAYTKLIMKVKKLEKTVNQQDQPEDQLGVFSAAKVLADAAKMFTPILEEEGQLVLVNINIPSPFVVKDKGKCIMIEYEPEQTKTKLQQRQERVGYEAAIRLQEQLDEEERRRIAKVHKEASSLNIEE